MKLVVIDMETYYGTGCNIRQLGETMYVRHPDFHVYSMSFQIIGEQDKARFLRAHEIPTFFEWLKTQENVGLIAHNMNFDGFVASEIYDYVPDFYFCTLSMARPYYGSVIKLDLDTLAVQALGIEGKKGSEVLDKLRNVPIDDLTEEDWANLEIYNNQDTEVCAQLFKSLIEHWDFPHDELRLIDLTTRLSTEPVLEVDEDLAIELYENEVHRKYEIARGVGVDPKDLTSNPKFEAVLKERGFEVPYKWSAKQKKEVPAFSKGDLPFKKMMESPNDELRALVAARVALKSSIVETRSRAFINRAGSPVPLVLKSNSAHTFRWGGGGKFNPQNLPSRDDTMAKLRHCLVAPDGYTLIVADAAQIEARVVAWLAGQDDLVTAFAAGEDVYCLFASMLYGREITKADTRERFVGKTAILGLGYQCGADRFRDMLALGQMGPPLILTEEEARKIVYTYRSTYPKIVQLWYNLNRSIPYLQDNDQTKELFDGLVFLETGRAWLPNGLFLSYPNVGYTIHPTFGSMEYHFRPIDRKTGHYVREKLYGGKFTENIVQSLARTVTAHHILKVARKHKVALMVHDEMVLCVPQYLASEIKEEVETIMAVPPAWAEGLPCRGEAHITPHYGKF